MTAAGMIAPEDRAVVTGMEHLRFGFRFSPFDKQSPSQARISMPPSLTGAGLSNLWAAEEKIWLRKEQYLGEFAVYHSGPARPASRAAAAAKMTALALSCGHWTKSEARP
jgi:hypothetical protein